MQSAPAASRLSRNGLVGLVYVAIALGVIANAAALTQTNIQWFQDASQLNIRVQNAHFNLGNGSTVAVASVQASLDNPTSFSFKLLVISYRLFVNSTSEPFSFQGSTEVGTLDLNSIKNIPSHTILNLTSTVPITKDTVDPLRTYVSNHQNDLTIYVGINLVLQSSYITINAPFCLQMPGQTQTICPPVRSATGGGGGGA